MEDFKLTKEEWKKREVSSVVEELKKKLSQTDRVVLKMYLKNLLEDKSEAFTFHLEAIKQAMEEGEEVPAEVLSSYPKLMSRILTEEENQLIELGFSLKAINRMTEESREFILKNKLNAEEVSIREEGGVKVILKTEKMSFDDEIRL